MQGNRANTGCLGNRDGEDRGGMVITDEDVNIP